ncbi:MAG: hypothetical protein KDH15_21500 [Rhodocyclaceae bacterium]|nr:hypothetical protein [Rhodocyclaceae bacterium]
MSLVLDDDYPLVLSLIAKSAYDALLERARLDPQTAGEIALAISENVRTNLGGGVPVYIPKGHYWAASKRHREIWDKFNGHNYEALAREYDMTVQMVRRIIERLRGAEMERRQRGLFGEG